MKIKLPDIGDFTNVDVIEILVEVGQIVNKNDHLISIETESKDIVFILPSKSLFDYQKRFKERVNARFSFG